MRGSVPLSFPDGCLGLIAPAAKTDGLRQQVTKWIDDRRTSEASRLASEQGERNGSALARSYASVGAKRTTRGFIPKPAATSRRAKLWAAVGCVATDRNEASAQWREVA